MNYTKQLDYGDKKILMRNLLEIGKKNGLAVSIAPLQLLTLAAFPPWGSSEGAGRR